MKGQGASTNCSHMIRGREGWGWHVIAADVSMWAVMGRLEVVMDEFCGVQRAALRVSALTLDVPKSDTTRARPSVGSPRTCLLLRANSRRIECMHSERCRKMSCPNNSPTRPPTQPLPADQPAPRPLPPRPLLSPRSQSGANDHAARGVNTTPTLPGVRVISFVSWKILCRLSCSPSPGRGAYSASLSAGKESVKREMMVETIETISTARNGSQARQ